MGRYSYFVLTSAHEGREAEFGRWYDEQHLDDVKRIPGVVAAQRFNVVLQRVAAADVPRWHSLTVYEIEAEDPQSVLSAISAVAGTEAMPLSSAHNRDGLIEVIAELAAKVER